MKNERQLFYHKEDVTNMQNWAFGAGTFVGGLLMLLAIVVFWNLR